MISTTFAYFEFGHVGLKNLHNGVGISFCCCESFSWTFTWTLSFMGSWSLMILSFHPFYLRVLASAFVSSLIYTMRPLYIWSDRVLAWSPWWGFVKDHIPWCVDVLNHRILASLSFPLIVIANKDTWYCLFIEFGLEMVRHINIAHAYIQRLWNDLL